MAEPTSTPSLPSTADTTPYAPLSWMAVAAATVALGFLITIVVAGVVSFRSKKPLLMEEILLLPVTAIVFSFVARRVIRNSEGTRIGEDLANAAWWTSLVLMLGYI